MAKSKRREPDTTAYCAQCHEFHEHGHHAPAPAPRTSAPGLAPGRRAEVRAVRNQHKVRTVLNHELEAHMLGTIAKDTRARYMESRKPSEKAEKHLARTSPARALRRDAPDRSRRIGAPAPRKPGGKGGTSQQG